MSFRIKVLADQQQVILRQLLEEAVNQDDNRATVKAKHFYKSCVDIRKYTRQIFAFLERNILSMNGKFQLKFEVLATNR